LKENDSINYVTESNKDGGTSIIDRIPEPLLNHDAGAILEYARNELDVSSSQFTRSSGINKRIMRQFESAECPLSDFLWKGYIRAIQDRHGITRAKASGLLQGLVGEIIKHNDHEQL
jgi:hypothetical protein